MDIDLGQLPRYVSGGPLIVYVPETVGMDEPLREEEEEGVVDASKLSEYQKRRIAAIQALRPKKAAAPAKIAAAPAKTVGELPAWITGMSTIKKVLLGLFAAGFVGGFWWKSRRAGR